MGQTLGGAFWIYRAPLILLGCNHEREALFPIYTDVETEAHRNCRPFISSEIYHIFRVMSPMTSPCEMRQWNLRQGAHLWSSTPGS